MVAGGGASVIYRYGRGRSLCHGRGGIHIQVRYMGCVKGACWGGSYTGIGGRALSVNL